jgi:hypothetical protein
MCLHGRVMFRGAQNLGDADRFLMIRSRVPACLMLGFLAPLLFHYASSVSAADSDDIVFLKNGGARGE